ncbi:IS605 family transposase OrfB, partial [mine drainage metagenome]
SVLTYQTRILASVEHSARLDAYAVLYGQAERSLFAALQAGKPLNALKSDFLKRFGLTARQFNAIRINLEGQIASIKERRPGLIHEAGVRIQKAGKVISKLARVAPGSNKLHQKKRRLSTLRARLAAMQSDHESGTIRLCFGSQRLFRAQFDREANGYADHATWRADWEATRSRQFFALGSQDETAGNQTCQARLEADGSFTLCLRLPDGLVDNGRKILELPGIRFAYGHDALVATLLSGRRIAAQTKAGKPIVKRVGAAISYRFLRDGKGWRVFASIEAQAVDHVSRRTLGALGIDINADHLALAETDRFGNLI